MTPIPAGPYYPTNALVAAAWIGQRVAGIAPSQVATRLPQDVSTWADEGFVQVTPITGSPDVDTGIRKPLVQVDCWAATVDAAGNVSTKQPVGKANRLAELIRTATELPSALYGRPVTMPANYSGAIVLSAYPLTEPVEVPDDPSGYARFTFDLALDWARA
jgi:hypothetical protein